MSLIRQLIWGQLASYPQQEDRRARWVREVVERDGISEDDAHALYDRVFALAREFRQMLPETLADLILTGAIQTSATVSERVELIERAMQENA